MTETLDRIRASLVGLRMPRALEALDHTMRRLERGELTALEAIDGLLAEEHATRETRRIGVALKTATADAAEDAGGASTSPSSPRSTATASWRSPSSTSSPAPRSCTSSARPAPARATSPPPSASPR